MNTNAIDKTQLVAEIELSYRPQIRMRDLPVIRESIDAYQLFLQSWDKTKLCFVEQFKVMLLNRANRVLGICLLSTGSSGYTIVDVKILFGTVLKGNADKIIIAHNHPSGSLKPSRHDEAITERIRKACVLFDIELADHFIISDDGYYSFAAEGTL